ncbi:MAG TPA: efflux transporter outer membrane subunit [Burkholderiales bacterium]|nr:efflux transporter outer membrane subunit [Burkholderiales bacterium]
MKKLLLPCLIGLLSACTTVGPDYSRPDVSLPSSFPSAPTTEEKAISTDWWKLYRDAQLEELIAAGQKSNADLRLAAARVLEAEALAREAGAAFLPEVTGGYSATRSRVSTQTLPPGARPLQRSQHQLLASTTFELDFWGRFTRASEAARANLLSLSFNRDVVSLSLSGAIAQAYFALRSLDAQAAVLDATIRARQDSLEIARARLQAGLSSELDVFQAQGALSDALVQKREAQRQRSLVERQLAQLTGRLDLKLPEGKPGGDLFALPIPPVPPAGLPSALLERRPDVRASEQALVAANAQIGVARAAMFPTLSLTGALGAQSAEFSDLLSSGAGIWSLGFGLALPLFDAGRREARVDQADARREQAVAGYQRSVETAFREVSDALASVEQTGGSEAELQARLQAARNALALSTARYESGYSPFLEVLDAQRTANEAELAFVRNRQARLAFSVDLMKALGGGWAAKGVEK